MKEKNASPASTSSTQVHQTGAHATSESEMGLPMAATSAGDGELTPVESAILCMDTELQAGLRLIRDIKNQTAMLETAFKLMSYEIGVISKNLKEKG